MGSDILQYLLAPVSDSRFQIPCFKDSHAKNDLEVQLMRTVAKRHSLTIAQRCGANIIAHSHWQAKPV